MTPASFISNVMTLPSVPSVCSVSLLAAVRVLVKRGLTISVDAGGLCVCWGDGPTLRISLNQAAHVAIEAARIGENTEFSAAMKRCNARFEIIINDLEEVLDEINTLIEVQATLQEFTGGYMFSAWNNQLTGPKASE